MGRLSAILLCLWTLGVNGQVIHLNYVVKNQLVLPRFELKLPMTVPKGMSLIRVMEAAANKSRRFDFTASYTSELGYLITEINGLASKYQTEKTYWEVYNRTNIYISGVSNYIPSDGDIVTFNFTR